MSTPSHADDVARTLKDIESLRLLIRRNGLTGFDESTKEGRMILALEAELQKAANPKVPDIIRQEGVMMAVEAMLFRRALATSIMRAKGPSPSSSKRAENQRAAYRIAVTAYKTFASSLQDALYLMGAEGFGLKVAPTKEKTIEDYMAERAARLEAHATQAAEIEESPAASPVKPAPTRDLPARPTERSVPDEPAACRAEGEDGTAVSGAAAGDTAAANLPVDA